MSTITAIESRSRLPAWSYIVLASVGAALGLWQVGFFDRQAGKERKRRVLPSPVTSAQNCATSRVVAGAEVRRASLPVRMTQQPVIAAMDDYPFGDDSDVEVLGETAALQAAMTAEEANDR